MHVPICIKRKEKKKNIHLYKSTLVIHTVNIKQYRCSVFKF
jgi:hypothetical protein